MCLFKRNRVAREERRTADLISFTFETCKTVQISSNGVLRIFQWVSGTSCVSRILRYKVTNFFTCTNAMYKRVLNVI